MKIKHIVWLAVLFAGLVNPAAAASARLILIDPGHGGVDPGVTAANGLEEKTVTLAVARRLAAVLQQRGYAVRLTRKSDTVVTQKQRRAMAAEMHADLFLSLHVDSNPDAAVRGASVYVYSLDRDGNTAKRSLQFAGKLTAKLSAATVLLAEKPLRLGRLTILSSPDVPSVLVELGYLSNPDDAAQMTSPAWQASISNAIADAVDDDLK